MPYSTPGVLNNYSVLCVVNGIEFLPSIIAEGPKNELIISMT